MPRFFPPKAVFYTFEKTTRAQTAPQAKENNGSSFPFLKQNFFHQLVQIVSQQQHPGLHQSELSHISCQRDGAGASVSVGEC